MLKVQSSVTPRLFTEGTKSTSQFPVRTFNHPVRLVIHIKADFTNSVVKTTTTTTKSRANEDISDITGNIQPMGRTADDSGVHWF